MPSSAPCKLLSLEAQHSSALGQKTGACEKVGVFLALLLLSSVSSQQPASKECLCDAATELNKDIIASTPSGMKGDSCFHQFRSLQMKPYLFIQGYRELY